MGEFEGCFVVQKGVFWGVFVLTKHVGAAFCVINMT